jgi:predicted nucleotidyltransferase
MATMGIEDLLSAKKPEILRAAKDHGAGNVRVFGSVARGDASADSDVDLLVDLEPGRSLLDHAALVLELEALLGRRVDVAVARGLRSRIRDRVLKEAIPL